MLLSTGIQRIGERLLPGTFKSNDLDALVIAARAAEPEF